MTNYSLRYSLYHQLLITHYSRSNGYLPSIAYYPLPINHTSYPRFIFTHHPLPTIKLLPITHYPRSTSYPSPITYDPLVTSYPSPSTYHLLTTHYPLPITHFQRFNLYPLPTTHQLLPTTQNLPTIKFLPIIYYQLPILYPPPIIDYPRFTTYHDYLRSTSYPRFTNYLRISPKCYYATCTESQEVKRSSKGIQLRVLLNYNDYKRSVYDSETKTVENISIRLHQNQMKTVHSKKLGLKNALFKAYVHDDRITVSPFRKFQ